MINANPPDSFDTDLDARLRKAYVPPPLAALHAQVREKIQKDLPRREFNFARAALAVAALVLLTLSVAGLWRIVAGEGPERTTATALASLWITSYQDSQKHGPSCCEPMGDLATLCESICKSQLAIAPNATISVVGMYCGTKAKGCVPLVVDCDGVRVCVFVLAKKDDPVVTQSERKEFFLHRREIGDLALYEVSEDATPRALQHFVKP